MGCSGKADVCVEGLCPFSPPLCDSGVLKSRQSCIFGVHLLVPQSQTYVLVFVFAISSGTASFPSCIPLKHIHEFSE